MIELFIGLPGTGKSLLMQDRVRQLTRQGWACFVLDLVEEWHPESFRWRGDAPKVADVPYPFPGVDWFAEKQEEAKGGIMFRFPAPYEGLDVAEAARKVGDCWYVDDEIDRTAITKGWQTNPLRDFVHRGRHMLMDDGEVREGHILGAARRVQYLHTDLTSMCDVMNVFRVRGLPTLKRIADEGWLNVVQVDEAANFPDLTLYVCTSDGKATKANLRPLTNIPKEEQRNKPIPNDTLQTKTKT